MAISTLWELGNIRPGECNCHGLAARWGSALNHLRVLAYYVYYVYDLRVALKIHISPGPDVIPWPPPTQCWLKALAARQTSQLPFRAGRGGGSETILVVELSKKRSNS